MGQETPIPSQEIYKYNRGHRTFKEGTVEQSAEI
jgi:hypothetical protein